MEQRSFNSDISEVRHGPVLGAQKGRAGADGAAEWEMLAFPAAAPALSPSIPIGQPRQESGLVGIAVACTPLDLGGSTQSIGTSRYTPAGPGASRLGEGCPLCLASPDSSSLLTCTLSQTLGNPAPHSFPVF